jgi:AcrR family transcriptional regulator
MAIAAAELIQEKGSLGFAMIDAARRANVSSAAPYRHCEDKDALLQAVSEVAFLALVRGRPPGIIAGTLWQQPMSHCPGQGLYQLCS